jgi:oxygenase
MTHTDVIVAGAGPVGLMLAGELRLGGASVAVLEGRDEPMDESRASQLNARTMEILDQRGLLAWLDPPQRENRGHFGGIPLAVGELDSPHAGYWKIPQYRTEAALRDWLARLGVPVRRGHQVGALADRGDHVEVVAQTVAGPQRLRASWLVGCDGQDSTVRALAGFGFDGHDDRRELLRADVTGVTVPDRRFERHDRGLAIAATRDGVTRVMMHEFGAPAAGRDTAPAFAEICAIWARITGEDISAGRATWTDAFGDASRQAPRYRQGRVLLAGDAAHRMMPAAGQALNVGLHDAVNLGWKLAAQAAGGAPPGLLDSYHDERHPVGARVLSNVEAQALLLLGDGQTDATRAVLGELLALPDARRHLAEMVSGLDVRYDLGDAGHELVGARMPDRELKTADGPQRISALLRPARGVLVDARGGAANPGATPAEVGAPWAGRVDVIVAAPADDAGFGAALIRPDGHVAWADGGPGELRTALERWFGAPAVQ